MITRRAFAIQVLDGLGVDGAAVSRTGARRAIVAWMLAESGHEKCNGTDGARYNPLNTTLYLSGGRTSSPDYNSVPVRNYTSATSGVIATVRTLQDPRYVDVVAALTRRWVTAKTVVDTIGASPWGTPTHLLEDALASYQMDRTTFNQLEVGS
jgi:hypothetical protein